MRRSIIHHIAAAVVIIFVMEVLPVASNEAHKRCQKSGCREGAPAAAEEPTLIVARSGRKSPSVKFFPFLMLWVASFVVLRMAIHYIHRLITLIPVAYSKLPEIRVGAFVGHYYDYFISIILRSARMMFSRRSRQKNKSRQGMRSRTSNRSLGSLADLLDDSSLDSSSAGYSSGYSITSSDGDSIDESFALESGSGSGFSGFALSDSSADSTSHTEDLSRRKDSIVSKFLTYISESNPEEFVTRRSLPPQRKNAPGPDDNKLRRSHNNMGTVGIHNQSSNNRDLGRKRRNSVDETNYPSYRTQFASIEGSNRRASTESSSNPRKGRTNVTESLSITRGKSSNEGVKIRKAVAKTKMASQNNVKSKSYNKGKSKSPKRQQQQKEHHEKEDKTKKSSLHHHFSKSSANKEDKEIYSTTIYTTDLRSRATPDSRATWDSASFVAK